MSASLVGQKLGKYEITDLLGHGGMATVYKGYQRDIDRYVAIKVLPPHPGQSEQFVERFRLEARTIARLQHPHILPLYDYGDENGVLYLVMAYADGGSLNDRIRRGALPLNEIQRVFEQVATALDYAHRQSVIHRDIKPDNILIDREGHALLADFGIVKILEDVNPETLTATGGLVGTPAYMSPEQAQGLPVDRRSDLYSLGIVLFEMLVGKQPFSAETPLQVVLKHMTAPVPSLRDFDAQFPPELDAVMQHALQKDPAQRYASAREFYDDFSRVLRGEDALTPVRANTPLPTPSGQSAYTPPGETPAAQPQPTVTVQKSTNPVVLLGGFAIIALLIVAALALLLNRENTTAPLPTATAIPVAALPTSAPGVPTLGRATFWSDAALGDTLSLQVNDLAQPPSGESYAVWLQNTLTGAVLSVGSLRLDPLGNGQLNFNDGSTLPTRYNALLITRERGEAATPSANVAYSGSVPPEVMDALAQILITSPDGIPAQPDDTTTTEPGYEDDAPQSSAVNSSLLAGALQEAEIAQRHAGLAADSTTAGSMHTHAEHTINILRGTQEDYNGNGRGENPGLGYGIANFTDRIQQRLDAIANAPTATRAVQSQLELIRVCLVNVRGWMNQVVTLETQQLTAEDVAAVHPALVESTNLATAILEGIDLNQNGQVEPFEGECGLQQINDFGVSVGNIALTAGALDES